jgi:hypothetical protein
MGGLDLSFPALLGELQPLNILTAKITANTVAYRLIILNFLNSVYYTFNRFYYNGLKKQRY